MPTLSGYNIYTLKGALKLVRHAMHLDLVTRLDQGRWEITDTGDGFRIFNKRHPMVGSHRTSTGLVEIRGEVRIDYYAADREIGPRTRNDLAALAENERPTGRFVPLPVKVTHILPRSEVIHFTGEDDGRTIMLGLPIRSNVIAVPLREAQRLLNGF